VGSLPRNTILLGDAGQRLRELPADSIDSVVTSPPYYQLRDYGVAGQIGLEPRVDDWVGALRRVFREITRVLKPAGAVWLNLGDAYSRHVRFGAPPKGLLMAPERLVVALTRDGWLVRNKVIWAKPNAMPHSVTDRLNTTHDFVYLLVRSQRYFFDLHAIREPHRSVRGRTASAPVCPPKGLGELADPNHGLLKARADGLPGHPLGKNPGDVWWIATRGFKGAHFATFPPELIRRPILATCPLKVCATCGAPWKTHATSRRIGDGRARTQDRFIVRYPTRYEVVRKGAHLVAQCACRTRTRPGVVLDPFFGTGTVGAVARDLGRDWIGIEINPEYVRLAEVRLGMSASESEAA